MTDKNTVIGKRIRKLRRAADYTQLQLAKTVKVDVSTISRIERGKTSMSQDTLEKLAKVLKTTTSNILSI